MTNTQSIQLNNLVLNTVEIGNAAKIIRALNHPFRQYVLKLISDAVEITVTDLYTKVGCEQSEISQCLAIMRKQSILNRRRDGKFLFYSINYERLNEINTFIKQITK